MSVRGLARLAIAAAMLLATDSPPVGARFIVPSPVGREESRPYLSGGYVPGELVALLRDEATLDAFAVEWAERGYPMLGMIPQLAAVQLRVPFGHEEAAMAALAGDPRVAHVEPNYLSRSSLVPDDEVYRDYQWNLRKIGMETAWEVTTGAPEVVVAVLDTGVDAGHPDLLGNVVAGFDFINDDPVAADDSSHGTYVAGVIAALGNNNEGVAGIAWRTKLLPVKVLDSQGVGPDAAVSKGIIFAVENRARIINISSVTSFPSRLLEEAVRFAERRGVLVVAAAGNSGDLGNEPIYPAAYSSVFAVAATNEFDDVPPFSQRQPYVAVAAPGVGIVGTAWRGAGDGLYIQSSGTSAAAPHVSGLAALLLAIKPDLTPTALRDLIRESADPVGPEPRQMTVGAGRINAARAVATLRPPPSRVAPGPSQAPSVAERAPTGPPPSGGLASIRPLPQPGPLPAEPLSWFFAEGNTTATFETFLLLQNPLAARARARVAYMTQDGLVAENVIEMAPNSRRSIRVNEVVPNQLVSIRVESDTTVFAERSMYFGHDGIGGAGARSPGRTWFMAEGSTQPPFDTWIVLQNPNPQPANAHLTFLLESGGTVEVDQPIGAESRTSIHANDVLPLSGFATVITSDVPIVAERTMYFARGGGHGSIGAKAPGRAWFLAEGDTRPGFDTWILLQNPGTEVANVVVTFMKEDGTTAVAYYALDPRTRFSLFADTVVPNASFGTRIDADQPIIVERSLYVNGGQGGHNSTAIQIPNTEWYLPEGSTRAPYREVLALLNPNAEPVQVDLNFVRTEGRQPPTQSFVIQPTSRLSFDAKSVVPSGEASTRVVADKPIVVERSMYFSRGATNAPGLTR
ncbi:MAG: S8 family serine peptidase [Chloroflexi bacterium]|nr:S8 family serine peptidase [Chloroflexota bacterium]